MSRLNLVSTETKRNTCVSGNTSFFDIEHELAHAQVEKWPFMLAFSQDNEAQPRHIVPSEQEVKFVLVGSWGSDQPTKLTSQQQDECYRSLRGLLKKSGKQNWDGEGAAPVTKDTVKVAEKIVDELPGDMSPPDIYANPRGNIEFDWHLDNGTMFTISIEEDGTVGFSGLYDRKTRLAGMQPDYNGEIHSLLRCGIEWLRGMQGYEFSK